MTHKQFCKAYGLTDAQFDGREKVGGDLDLSSLTSIPEGFNPTVGGDLDLSSLTSIPEGFNPTVGGDLYLSILTSIPEGFNPTVGGGLDLSGRPKNIGASVNVWPMMWQDGRYIMVDGIVQEVMEQRGNVYHVRSIGKQHIGYLVTDGNGSWAHGDTLDEAREDLLYKIGKRAPDAFKGIAMDEPLEFSKAVAMYRAITGACAAGCREFVERKGLSKDRTYTPAQMLEITRGAYNHESLAKFLNTPTR